MTRIFTDIFGMGSPVPGEGPEINIRRVAMQATKHGYGIVPVKPLGKKPLCTLTRIERKKHGAAHNCSTYHVITDPREADRVFARMQREIHKGDPDLNINLGIVAGPSRLINVDADTPESVAAFQALWPGAPTVRTPGAFRDGVWKHSDGGHWYFDLPEGVVLPSLTTKHRYEGADIRWGMQMAVAPPSVREEGPYRAQGDIPNVPAFLLEMITDIDATARRKQADLADRFVNDNVARWSVITPWAHLLVPDGWDATGKDDMTCGCPVWEKPGGGSTSDRSAVAHSVDCRSERYENIEGHAPLHWFTDEPPPGLTAYSAVNGASQTVTKLQYVAWMHHGGDIDKAKVALGLTHDTTSFWFDGPVSQFTYGADSPVTEKPLLDAHISRTEDQSYVDDPPVREEPLLDAPISTPISRTGQFDIPPYNPPSVREEIPVLDEVLVEEDIGDMVQEAIVKRYAQLGRPVTDEKLRDAMGLAAMHLDNRVIKGALDDAERRKLTPMRHEPTMLEAWDCDVEESTPSVLRIDDSYLFYRGRTNLLFGRRGSCKTWIAMLACLDGIDQGGRSCYVDLEDTLPAMRSRFETTLGIDMRPAIEGDQFLWRRLPSLDSASMHELINDLAVYDVVVFDVLSRMVGRLGGDVNTGNTETMALFDQLFDPLADRGVCVVILAHPNKAGQKKSVDIEELEPAGGAKTMDNLSGHAIALRPIRQLTKEDSTNAEIHLISKKDRSGNFIEDAVIGALRSKAGVSADYGRLCTELTITRNVTSVEDLSIKAGEAVMEILESHTTMPVRVIDIKLPDYLSDLRSGALKALHDSGRVVLYGDAVMLVGASIVTHDIPVQTRIVDGLMKRPGEWYSTSDTRALAGSRNGTPSINDAINVLVQLGVIESRTIEISGGREGVQYRYKQEEQI